ncbi:MAG: hypothetical protein J6F31_01635 [Oscillospiraceae bacterium]|nr:hypothetical protein [Oscillospiraceae bacterium]
MCIRRSAERIAGIILVLCASMLLFTSCSKPKAVGKVKDGVYRNTMFSVTTPTENSIREVKGENIEDQSSYATLYLNSANRQAHKTFVCEYYARGKGVSMAVCSEKNVAGFTLDGFADEIATKTDQGNVLQDMETIENDTVTLNGVSFRHIKCRMTENDTYWDYYIKQYGDRFVYIYINYIKTDKDDYSIPMTEAIGAP